MTRPPVDFGALAGRELPGGCDLCDAFQTLDEVEPAVWLLTVHHDADCPDYRARTGRRGEN